MSTNYYGKLGSHAHQSFARQIAAPFANTYVNVLHEYPVFAEDEYFGSIDLVLEAWRLRIAVEIELSADRVLADVEKARLAQADQLIVCVPNATVRRAVVSKLVRHEISSDAPPRLVMTQHQTLRQLTSVFHTALLPRNQVLVSGEVAVEGTEESGGEGGSKGGAVSE